MAIDCPLLDLPQTVVDNYRKSGLTTLYPWQRECLLQDPGVLQGTRNLVYHAPTSAGKTLVADLVTLRHVLRFRRKALMILPYVAIVSEKVESIGAILEGQNIDVAGYYGKQKHIPFEEVDMAICTIEKANSIVNQLIESGQIQDLGIVVVDEMHMIGDENRGYMIELMLTKLRFLKPSIQIVGMSATLSNLPDISDWLDAHLFVSEYRPVPLTEYLKVGKQILKSDGSLDRVVDLPIKKDDPDQLCPLVYECVIEGHSVIVFCPSQISTVSAIRTLSTYIRIQLSDIQRARCNEILAQLSRTPGGLDPALAEAIPYGMAYHHGGLTVEERHIIEKGFRDGTLFCLAATSTLASGVNLPARRVIIRHPFMGNRRLDALSYSQMKGRAGRKGLDTRGECILFAGSQPVSLQRQKQLLSLMTETPQPVSSCLIRDQRALKRTLLEIIFSEMASTLTEIHQYICFTLMYAQNGPVEDTLRAVDQALHFLTEHRMIEATSSETKYSATRLGVATVHSALSPDEALIVFLDLVKAQKAFNLENELHLTYQITPSYQLVEPDWRNFAVLLRNMSPSMWQVARLIGISEGLVQWAASGSKPKDEPGHHHYPATTHKRFYCALILDGLLKEQTYGELVHRFKITRGTVQTLQASASTFAGMVRKFTSRLGWNALEVLLEQFQTRVAFGVRKELVELVAIPACQEGRARMLYDAGFTSISLLASAPQEAIYQCLIKGRP
ncbi:hypothetical protein CXG81DRAFT_9766, partial [Caulochytrium protostelioides]